MSKFRYVIEGSTEREIEIASGVYILAAIAAVIRDTSYGPGTKDKPTVIKIWFPPVLPEYGPYTYGVYQTGDGVEAGVIAPDHEGRLCLITSGPDRA